MMNSIELTTVLQGLPLSEVSFYESVGSTNDLALERIGSGAVDAALVIANTQTAGRGRFKRHWITRPDSSLAFSLVLRPEVEMIIKGAERLGLFSLLGGVAVCRALEGLGVKALIKWPNDVLLERRKVSGILTEASWQGSQLQGIVLGIGVNVASDSVPPDAEVRFPATSVEGVVGVQVDRYQLLASILGGLLDWRGFLFTQEFVTYVESHLAFCEEWVHLHQGEESLPEVVKVKGIHSDGSLIIQAIDGQRKMINTGEISLRPITENPKTLEVGYVN